MQNQHRVFLFVSGLLFLNAAQAMEMNRANRIEEYKTMHRGLSERELFNELKNLEFQLAQFMDRDDFAIYMQEPDKLNFLLYQLSAVGNTMPADMLYRVQQIIAVLSTLQTRKQQSEIFWSESE